MRSVIARAIVLMCFFFALAFLTLAVGCRSRDSESTVAAPSSRPNVLLVTIDTLRADHVGSYGYHEASTPTIDALARRGVPSRRRWLITTDRSRASISPARRRLGMVFEQRIHRRWKRKTVAQIPERGLSPPVYSGFALIRFVRSRIETYDDRLPPGMIGAYLMSTRGMRRPSGARRLATASPRACSRLPGVPLSITRSVRANERHG